MHYQLIGTHNSRAVTRWPEHSRWECLEPTACTCKHSNRLDGCLLCKLQNVKEHMVYCLTAEEYRCIPNALLKLAIEQLCILATNWSIAEKGTLFTNYCPANYPNSKISLSLYLASFCIFLNYRIFTLRVAPILGSFSRRKGGQEEGRERIHELCLQTEASVTLWKEHRTLGLKPWIQVLAPPLVVHI